MAKHRNGPTGTINVRWISHTASFQDLLLRAEPAPDYDGGGASALPGGGPDRLN